MSDILRIIVLLLGWAALGLYLAAMLGAYSDWYQVANIAIIALSLRMAVFGAEQ